MAESTLSLTCTQLRNAISFAAGYGATAATSGTKSDKIDELLESGLRQFYFPPAVPDPSDPQRKPIVHVWSFLRPTTTLIAWDSIEEDVAEDQTITVTGDAFADPITTITATAALFTSNLVGKYLAIEGIGAFAIASYVSSTVVTVTGNASSASADYCSVGEATVTNTSTQLDASKGTPFAETMVGKTISINVGGTLTDTTITAYTSSTRVTVAADVSASDDTFEIIADGDYQLPDNFGNMIGKFSYDAQTVYPAIPVGAEGDIRQRRQLQPDRSSRPFLSAIRPMACDGTAGQRFELMLWPIPNDDYTLHYRYTILPDALVVSTNPYAYGGMAHAETIRESCLAIAEESLDDTRGVHYVKFMERLAVSISYDRKMGPQYLGPGRTDAGRSFDSHNMPNNYVTYNP